MKLPVKYEFMGEDSTVLRHLPDELPEMALREMVVLRFCDENQRTRFVTVIAVHYDLDLQMFLLVVTDDMLKESRRV